MMDVDEMLSSDDDFINKKPRTKIKPTDQPPKKCATAYSCKICDFKGTTMALLQSHMYDQHATSELACNMCAHVAISRDALRQHRQRKGCKQPRKTFRCREEMQHQRASGSICTQSFSSRDDLRRHLAEQHGCRAAEEKQEVLFASEEEFALWLHQYERKNGVHYVVRQSTPSGSTYQCSRSGTHMPAGSGKRRMKSQGSAKLGFGCLSTLRVTDRGGGALAAVVHEYHYGHATGVSNLPHIRIPAADRAVARGKLAAGVSTSRVMKDMRDLHGGDSAAGPSRTYWIQRKDVQNMCKSMGITPGGDNTKNPNEVLSVRMHAEEIQSSAKRHLLAFKMPGEQGTEGTDSLDDKDFVLAFCTEHQLRKFVQHGSKVVCMDGTHGTSGRNGSSGGV